MLDARDILPFFKSAVLGNRGRGFAPLVPYVVGMKPGTTAGNRNTFLSDQSDKLSVSEGCGVLYPRGESEPIIVGSR